MRLDWLSIRGRLALGFTILLLLTLTMGVFAVRTAQQQADITEAMHRHPLTVSNTVRDIRSHILAMHRNMKDVVIADETESIRRIAALVDDQERQVLAGYDLLEERFLGDLQHVEAARAAFEAWRPIRQRVFDFMDQGAVRAATDITRHEGAFHVEEMQRLNEVMSDFASAKGHEFFNEARRQDRAALIRTLVLLGLLVIVAILTATVVARSITEPLSVVGRGIARLSSGRLDYRIPLDTRDEVGTLARDINEMADELDRTTASVEVLHRLIAEREAAEDRVEGLGRIIENSLSETFVFDAETFRFLIVNHGARRNIGYSMEELADLTPRDLDAQYTAEDLDELLRPLIEEEVDRLRVATSLCRKDGTIYMVDIDVQRSEYEGRPVLVAHVVDTTERIRLEEERRLLESRVQHTQKLESLGVLAGGIAHDFNNILMTVLGNAAIALEDLPAASSVRGCVTDIEVAAKRATDLCRQMLAYSGKGRFEVKVLDMSRVVEEIGHMIEISVSKTVVLKYELAEGLPPVEVDATQIGQVILNLITNASEAIGDRSGVVSVATSVQYCDPEYLEMVSPDRVLTEGYYVTVEVSDTGCGMPDAVKQRMFEPFYTTKFTGRGLGMAAVLGIIRGHEGAINVYSEEGRGTTIKVLLPISDRAYEDLDDATRVHHVRAGGKALLVDDEESVRALGRLMLERMGYEVLVAEDGREGAALFEEHAEGLEFVLLDLTMPHMDGREAYRAMQKVRADVPIILSSGYSAQDVQQQFSGRRIAGFIQKPYQPQDLARKLNEVLGS